MRTNSEGTRLAAVISNASSSDGTTSRLRIWDLTTGRQLLTLDRERLGGLPAIENALSQQAWNDAGTHVAVSVRRADVRPDGELVTRADWFVAIVEVASGRIVSTGKTAKSKIGAFFRHDGKLLALGTTVAGVEGRGTRVELVDPDSGRVVLERSGNLPSGVGSPSISVPTAAGWQFSAVIHLREYPLQDFDLGPRSGLRPSQCESMVLPHSFRI